eukprot:2888139-Prymnesium_polylepis.1
MGDEKADSVSGSSTYLLPWLDESLSSSGTSGNASGGMWSYSLYGMAVSSTTPFERNFCQLSNRYSVALSLIIKRFHYISARDETSAPRPAPARNRLKPLENS